METTTGLGSPIPGLGMKFKKGKSPIWIFLGIPPSMTIAIESSPRNLFIDMVVDGFIFNQITPFTCFTFIPKSCENISKIEKVLLRSTWKFRSEFFWILLDIWPHILRVIWILIMNLRWEFEEKCNEIIRRYISIASRFRIVTSDKLFCWQECVVSSHSFDSRVTREKVLKKII